MNKELSNYLEYESQILNGLAPLAALLKKVVFKNADILSNVIVSDRNNKNLAEYINRLNDLVSNLEELHNLPKKLSDSQRVEDGIYYKLATAKK